MLAFNALTTLPLGLFPWAGVQKVLLHNNALEALPGGLLDNTSTLVFFACNDNALTGLPAGLFRTTPLLQTVTLNSNQLSALPADLFSVTASLTTMWGVWLAG